MNSFPDKPEKEIKQIQHKFYSHFSDIVLEGIKGLYGIYGGTKEQALKKKKKLNLNLDKEYTLFIDNSMGNSFDNTNFGVRIIKNGENILFKENMKSEFSFGIIFILMGIIFSSIKMIIRIRKLRKNYLRTN